MPTSRIEDRPDRLVQTKLTPEARASLQALADEESDGSVATWVRRLIMRELWAKKDKLKRRGLGPLHVSASPEETVNTRIRVDFDAAISKEIHDSMSTLSAFDGLTITAWLKNVIVKEIHRHRKRLAAVKRIQEVTKR